MFIAPDHQECPTPDESMRAIACRVFDGDGFLAKVWHPWRQAWVERISFRFAFIDAPEIAQPYGVEAREALQHLILGKELRLALIYKDSMGPVPLDPYYRFLCIGYLSSRLDPGPVDYFWKGRGGSGLNRRAREVIRNVELEMVANGCAWVVDRWSFEREAEYFAAQDDARRHRRGLWAHNNPEPPWEYKRRHRKPKARVEQQGSLI